jgi:hypothetical protein
MSHDVDKWVVGVGLGLLAVSQAVAPVGLDSYVAEKFLASVGLILLGVGCFAFLVRKVPRPVSTEYFVRNCTLRDSTTAYQLMMQLLGKDIAPQAQMESWIKRDPRCIQLLFATRRRGRSSKLKMVGFFSIFEVSQSTKDLMLRNEIFGLALTASKVMAPPSTGAALYLGAAGAETKVQRGELLRHINAHVMQRANDKMDTIITRPIANAKGQFESLNAMTRRGFKSVRPDASIGGVNYACPTRELGGIMSSRT